MSTNLTFATGVRPQGIRFVLVNNRIPRTDEHCALCGGLIDKGYVRESQTRFIYCDTQCFAGWTLDLNSGGERGCSYAQTGTTYEPFCHTELANRDKG